MSRRYRWPTVSLAFTVVIYVILLTVIFYLFEENTTLKAKITRLSVLHSYKANNEKSLRKSASSTSTDKAFERAPTTRKRDKISRRPTEFQQENLTFILFKKAGLNDSSYSFDDQMRDLKNRFPSSSFMCNKDVTGLGRSLNHMISQVATEYFLVLEPGVKLSERRGEGITSLWNALEQFPEVDFVGGAYLYSDGKLHVPCERYRICRWTFSESYEYTRSLDNIMVCDGTSTSFMGRKASMRKVSAGFDENLPDILVVKDFFVRAKSSSVVIGTRPNVMFLIRQFVSLHKLWTSRAVTKELVPFAVKHKVFILKDSQSNEIDLCGMTSPLSGKDLCIETNSHELMLGGGHWAYKGLFAYPYLYKYLEITLLEVSDFLNRHGVTYFVEGGVSLGAIKMRSILPWDSGDIDILVYDLDLDGLYDLLKPLADQKGYIVRRRPDQVHVFCTPRNVGDLSGGIATIFPTNTKAPPRGELIKVQTNGKWISYKRELIARLIDHYGEGYLEHHMHSTRETMACGIKGHNACVPNFKSIFEGKGGTAREYFCEL